MKSAIAGIGAALPEDVVTNADLEARLDTTDEWIQKRTGIRERRRLNGTLDLTDLAAQACVAALADAGLGAADVDQLIVATVSAPRITPGVAPGVATALGIERAAAFDLNAACAGWLYALDAASASIESGRAEVVVVCGAEALHSQLTDHEDRGTAVLFGDGAGAVVLVGGDFEHGIAPLTVGCDGAHAESLYAERDERKLRMQGREVYRHAVRRMIEATRAALAREGLGVEDIDLFVPHQANARIVEAVAAELDMPLERVFMNVDRVANTSAASIPLALSDAEREGRLWPGARVGLAAFGAGYVWGAGVIRWKEAALVRS